MEKDSRLIVMMVIIEMGMDAARIAKFRKDTTAKEGLQSNPVIVYHSYLTNPISQPQEQFICSEELFKGSVWVIFHLN